MRVLNRLQSQDADRITIQDVGIPSAQLMENAGREVVSAMAAFFPDLTARRVVVLAGRGNNGGDGFVVARLLAGERIVVAVFVIGSLATIAGDARAKLDGLASTGVPVTEIADDETWERLRPDSFDADIIVDALVGTGLTKPLTGLMARVVSDVNASKASVVAVDLPSGLSARHSALIGPTIRAALTVTFAAPKIPLLVSPADASVGHLVVADIGIPSSVIDTLAGPEVHVRSKAALRTLVAPRSSTANKGDYGRVLIVGGSRGKTGAPALSARAALRSGAGLVTVATPKSCWPVVASYAPEVMTDPLPETVDGMVDASALEQVLAFHADVIGIGPGLGRSTSTIEFVHGLVARSTVPLVIDADALNAFEGHADLLVGRPGADVIITPHPGEMARLTGTSAAQVQSNRLDVARAFATAHRVWVVLKGHRTIIATPEGQAFINLTGNPGMATAGTGDVLTGVTAAWHAQGLAPGDAAILAVYLHGRAGDLAAREGQVGLVAGDVIAHLRAALVDLMAPSTTAEDGA